MTNLACFYYLPFKALLLLLLLFFSCRNGKNKVFALEDETTETLRHQVYALFTSLDLSANATYPTLRGRQIVREIVNVPLPGPGAGLAYELVDFPDRDALSGMKLQIDVTMETILIQMTQRPTTPLPYQEDLILSFDHNFLDASLLQPTTTTELPSHIQFEVLPLLTVVDFLDTDFSSLLFSPDLPNGALRVRWTDTSLGYATADTVNASLPESNFPTILEFAYQLNIAPTQAPTSTPAPTMFPTYESLPTTLPTMADLDAQTITSASTRQSSTFLWIALLLGSLFCHCFN